MDKSKMRELLEFAKDDKRVNAAFDRVIDGIESGAITADDFPFAVGPLKDKRLEAPEPLTQSVTITIRGEALDSLNAYRQAAHAARMTSEGNQDEREEKRLRAASDLAGWVSSIVNVAPE